jgi:hypothetical protein
LKEVVTCVIEEKTAVAINKLPKGNFFMKVQTFQSFCLVLIL